MEIKAKIYKIGDAIQVTEKFKKRELIVSTDLDSQYPQHLKVQLSQDKCALADTLQVGQHVTLSINLRGKLYTDKNGVENAITNVEVWKVQADAVPTAMSAPTCSEAASDLPF